MSGLRDWPEIKKAADRRPFVQNQDLG